MAALSKSPLSSQLQAKGLSLFFRVAAFVFVTSATTVTTLTGVSYFAARHIIRQQVEQRLNLAAAQRAQAIEMYVRQQHERVRLIASRTRLRQLLRRWMHQEIVSEELQSEASQILLDALAGSEDFTQIALADLSGRIVAATSPGVIGVDMAEELSFHQAQSAPFLSEFNRVNDEYLTLLAAPAQDEASQLLGVIFVTLKSSSLIEVIANPVGLGQTGEALIGRKDGKHRVRYLLPTRRGNAHQIDADKASSMLRALAGLHGFERTMYDNEDVLIAFEPVAYQPGFQAWGLVVKITAAEAFTPLDNLRRIVLPLGLLLLIPALLSAYWLGSRYARPIMQLAESAAIFAKGNLKHRVPAGETDEIGALSRALNEMAEQLEASYEELEQRVAARTDELSRANQELARSNRELEQFAYVASHDLQEPLRAITGFARLLRDQPGGDASPQSQEYLDFVLDGAADEALDRQPAGILPRPLARGPPQEDQQPAGAEPCPGESEFHDRNAGGRRDGRGIGRRAGRPKPADSAVSESDQQCDQVLPEQAASDPGSSRGG